ncbi:MAG: hypothetical protein R3C10_09785 [Pirellulales bacterium]|nr:hypothetical protein [Planctomycetales bacterium]
MSTLLKTITLASTVLGLMVASSARADFRDYNNKAWAQVSRHHTAQPTMRVYRQAPVVENAAPAVVAQAPSQQRSFSYEPSEATTSGQCGSADAQPSQDAAAETAQAPTETRSFSYEPSAGTAVMRTGRSVSRQSTTPRYLLQKTNPHKYLGN